MRYFFVSDIHGEFDALVKALTDANFNAAADTLVVVGDSFDRGNKSRQVLEFILQCPNRILIWGNHDLRLQEICHDVWRYDWHDGQNGVLKTIKSILGKNRTDNTWDDLAALNNNMRLRRYFNECVLCAEWPDYIAVHAWLPHYKNKLMPKEEWTRFDWKEATWAHTENCIKEKMFPEKKLIIGHWHAWRLREFMGGFKYTKADDVDVSTFETEHFIALDGCTNYSKKVNVFIYETDVAPILTSMQDIVNIA